MRLPAAILGACAVPSAAAFLRWWARIVYREDSALLLAAQRVSLYGEGAAPVADSWGVDAGEADGRAEGAGGVVFVIYHKSGTEFSKRFLRHLYGEIDERQNGSQTFSANTVVLGGPWTEPLPTVGFRPCTVAMPSPAWPLPGGARVVHWYRDPVSMILSGYRYHRGAHGKHGADFTHWSWMTTQAMSHCADQAATTAIFEACRFRCHYNDLLNHVSDETGALMEALMSRQVVRHLRANLLRWSRHPNVLHLSVEQLQGDFNGTTRCLLRFLGHEGEDHVERVQALDISKTNSLHRVSGRYDNSALRDFLVGHPVWGRDLAAARWGGVLRNISARQSHLYGCPAAHQGPAS